MIVGHTFVWRWQFVSSSVDLNIGDGLTQINNSTDIVMVALRVAALAGELGSSTKCAVDARTRVIATNRLDSLSIRILLTSW